MKKKRILVLGDTHLRGNEPLPNGLLHEIKNADYIIHLGDYISPSLVTSLMHIKNRTFLGVFGNADPLSIRKMLPAINEVTIQDSKICFTHPFEGGDIEITERRVLSKLKNKNPDVILYGHTHEPRIYKIEEILIINPGKAYTEKGTFGGPATYACVEIDANVKAQIKTITE